MKTNELRKLIRLAKAEQIKEEEINRRFGMASYPGKAIYQADINNMRKKIKEKTNMVEIKTALKEKDFCNTMSELGFELFGYEDDYPDDYYFMAKDNSLIVFVSMVNAVFYTYPRCNRGELKWK